MDVPAAFCRGFCKLVLEAFAQRGIWKRFSEHSFADCAGRTIGYATFFGHIHTPELLRARSAQLFAWVTEGRLGVHVGGEYPLADAARAHADMESRKTTGKLLLVP